MYKLIFLLILLNITAYSQRDLKLVRHDAITESWLAGDRESCYNKLVQAYKSYPDSFIISYNLGYLNLLDGKLSRALSFFQDAKKLNPEYPYTYLMISKIYQQSNNIVSANTVLHTGLKYDSDNYELQLQLARVYKITENFDEAIQIYSKLIDEYEDEFEPRSELASIYRAQKRYNRAANLLDFSSEEYPESIAVLEKYKLYRDSKNEEEAKKALLILLSTYPNSSKFQKYVDTLKINYGVNDPPEPEKFVQYKYQLDPSEKLNYMVEYGFLTLGWMKVRLEKEIIINGKKVYHIVFYIDSNPDFDFIISLHPIYESYIDAETLSAVRSRLYTPEGEDTYLRMYYFDYDKNIFTSYCIKNDGRYVLLSKDLPNAAQDGTSMLYLARGLVSNKISGTTVVVINEKFKYAVIKFLNETEEVDVNGEDVNALKIFAQAKFSGVAGMNGDAYGWFTTDNQSVPLEGKIEIIVGSITVRIADED